MSGEEREELALRTIPTACRLVCAVRDSAEDVEATLAGLSPEEVTALAVVLAAMVPDDRTPTDLLGWIVPRSTVRRSMWSEERLRWAHAAYERLRRTRQPISAEIRDGEREYNQRRKAAQKARAQHA